jgi:cytidyltransferase-like protein
MSALLQTVPFFQDRHSYIYTDVLRSYSEPWRHFHTIKHVENILLRIRAYVDDPAQHETGETAAENINRTRAYLFAAVFHDIVYEPWCTVPGKNEAESILVLYRHLEHIESAEVLQMAADLIRATGNLSYDGGDEFTNRFLLWDRAWILQARTVTDLIRNGHRIWQEYSFHPYHDFVDGHMDIVSKVYWNSRVSVDDVYVDKETIEAYGQYLQNRRPRLALYPGSFNPYHIGHSYIAAQAQAMFDKVVIATGVNPSKLPMYNAWGIITPERVGRGKSSWVPRNLLMDDKSNQNYEHVEFAGMLSDLVRDFTDLGYDVVVVKGIRNAADLESEMVQAEFTRADNPEVKYAYIPCPAALAHISSSAIRTLKQFSKNYDDYIAAITDNVEQHPTPV